MITGGHKKNAFFSSITFKIVMGTYFCIFPSKLVKKGEFKGLEMGRGKERKKKTKKKKI